MSKELFFSIVIPTYNRADLIEKSINSALNQTYQNFEIIVVDDGSTDNTEEVVKKIISNRIKYFRIVNSERAAARNFGIDKSMGDYITFLDSDDIYYPDYLANAVESIRNYSCPAFFHLAYEFKSAKSNKSIRKYMVENDDIKSLIKGNHLSCLGIFIDRKVTERFRFNEDRNLSGSEDWELWLRLAANFGIKTDQRVSGALMIHTTRSVFNYPEDKLLLRKNLALKYAFEDKAVSEKYGNYKYSMEGYCDSYIALHLALSGNNVKALKYLTRAFMIYHLTIFNIRTIAIFKIIILNVLRLRK